MAERASRMTLLYGWYCVHEEYIGGARYGSQIRTYLRLLLRTRSRGRFRRDGYLIVLSLGCRLWSLLSLGYRLW